MFAPLRRSATASPPASSSGTKPAVPSRPPNAAWSRLATGGGVPAQTLQRQTPAPAAPPAEEAPAPAGRLANEREIKIITQAEADRLSLLSKALPLVQQLIAYITFGDPGATRDPQGKNVKKGTPPGLEVTKKAAAEHLNVRPNTYDWLNDPKDKQALDTLTTAARVMSINLAKPIYPKLVFDLPAGGRGPDPCAPGQAANNDGTRVNFQADFFVSADPPMPSPQCPGIILMHEYFHHIMINPEAPPSQRELVYHGAKGSGENSTLWALTSAYNLTSFTVHVATGTGTECVCPKGSTYTPPASSAPFGEKPTNSYDDGVMPSQSIA